MPSTLNFSLTLTVADIDDTVPGDPGHPSLVEIVDGAFGLVRVVVPPPACSLPRAILQAGLRLRVTCEPTLKLPPVATHIESIEPLH